jgi:protein regulator of cytokinesis 1
VFIKLFIASIVDPVEFLSYMEKQVVQAKHETSIRKEILEKMEKWMLTCEEEGWLEDCNKVWMSQGQM